jgi:cell division septum initiation protein DivIVA
MDPAEITASGLPRSAVGGYKPGPTNELLRRVGWDYRQLIYEHATLSSAVDEFTHRIAELEAQLEQLQQAPDDLPPADLEATAEAEQILADAQRAAEELRRTTEAECEALLEQARTRSRELDRQLPKPTTDEQHVAALQALRAQVSSELRATLERIIDLELPGPPTADPSPAATTAERPA